MGVNKNKLNVQRATNSQLNCSDSINHNSVRFRRCDNTSDYMTASTNIVVRIIELKLFDYRVNFFCVAELANNDNRRISWMNTICVKWHISLPDIIPYEDFIASDPVRCQSTCLFVNFTFSMCASICHIGENILIKSSIFLFWEFMLMIQEWVRS